MATARPGAARVATAVYALSLAGLFASSAAYHLLRWSPTALQRMRRLDHSMIFLLIAGTYTAIGALALRGTWRIAILGLVWTGALVGIALKTIKIDGFRRTGGTLYIALGWAVILALPQVLREVEALPLLLIVAGGVLYTVGAVVLLRRSPDPRPLVFGYHEIWHAFVVAASLCHYVAILLIARSPA